MLLKERTQPSTPRLSRALTPDFEKREAQELRPPASKVRGGLQFRVYSSRFSIKPLGFHGSGFGLLGRRSRAFALDFRPNFGSGRKASAMD